VEQRARLGDWESDSIESTDHKPGINTFVERKTGLVFITKLKSKTSEATISAIESRTKRLPKKARQTATFDNGPENQKWQEFKNRTGFKSFLPILTTLGKEGRMKIPMVLSEITFLRKQILL